MFASSETNERRKIIKIPLQTGGQNNTRIILSQIGSITVIDNRTLRKKPRNHMTSGLFNWGARQCPTFTGNTTNYHRR